MNYKNLWTQLDYFDDEPSVDHQWVEAAITGLSLSTVVEELLALKESQEDAQPRSSASVRIWLAADLDRVLTIGLRALPSSKFQEILREPGLLGGLQELILEEGGPFWQEKFDCNTATGRLAETLKGRLFPTSVGDQVVAVRGSCVSSSVNVVVGEAANNNSGSGSQESSESGVFVPAARFQGAHPTTTPEGRIPRPQGGEKGKTVALTREGNGKFSATAPSGAAATPFSGVPSGGSRRKAPTPRSVLALISLASALAVLVLTVPSNWHSPEDGEQREFEKTMIVRGKSTLKGPVTEGDEVTWPTHPWGRIEDTSTRPSPMNPRVLIEQADDWLRRVQEANVASTEQNTVALADARLAINKLNRLASVGGILVSGSAVQKIQNVCKHALQDLLDLEESMPPASWRTVGDWAPKAEIVKALTRVRNALGDSRDVTDEINQNNPVGAGEQKTRDATETRDVPVSDSIGV